MTVFTRELEQVARHTRPGFSVEYDSHNTCLWFSMESFTDQVGLLEVRDTA